MKVCRKRKCPHCGSGNIARDYKRSLYTIYHCREELCGKGFWGKPISIRGVLIVFISELVPPSESTHPALANKA